MKNIFGYNLATIARLKFTKTFCKIVKNLVLNNFPIPVKFVSVPNSKISIVLNLKWPMTIA